MRGKDGDPGRRQLDGQREPVQPPADRHHVAGVLAVDHEGGTHRPGPVQEQPDRPEPLQAGRRRQRPRVGQRQRRHREELLAGDAQQRPAGHQQREAGGTAEQLDQQRPGRRQVLEAVEEQQHPLRPQVCRHRAGVRRVTHLQADRPGDRGRHQPSVADRGQQDERHRVESRVQGGGHIHGQPGLAHPAGPVSVTSRATRPSSRSRSAAASRSRPTIGVSGTGR
jgi:hypothetical protein